MTAECLRKTRSGLPGSEDWCKRYRKPAAKSRLRSCISGRVFAALILAIIALRLDGENVSTISKSPPVQALFWGMKNWRRSEYGWAAGQSAAGQLHPFFLRIDFMSTSRHRLLSGECNRPNDMFLDPAYGGDYQTVPRQVVSVIVSFWKNIALG